MAAGTIYVYARDGVGSSVNGSEGLGGKMDTGHVFVTVRDNEAREQIDVDVWRGPNGEMYVNEVVSFDRREQHSVVAFDIDRETLDRAMAAAENFHRESQGYEVFSFNCTDAVEAVLSQTNLPIQDYTFPASVFNAIQELGAAGRLDGYAVAFCDDVGRPPDHSPGGFPSGHAPPSGGPDAH